MPSEEQRNQPPFENGRFSGPGCPFLSVVAVNEHGMVLESRSGFDVGAAISLGFHLDSEDQRSQFVSAEGIVVESRCHLAANGKILNRVTLLFSEISREDRNILVRYSQESGASAEEKLDAGTPSGPSVSGDGGASPLWLN